VYFLGSHPALYESKFDITGSDYEDKHMLEGLPLIMTKNHHYDQMNANDKNVRKHLKEVKNIQMETLCRRVCNTSVMIDNETRNNSPEWAKENYILRDNLNSCRCSNMIQVIEHIYEFMGKEKDTYKELMEGRTYMKNKLVEYLNSSFINQNRNVNNTLRPISRRSKPWEKEDTLNNNTRDLWDYVNMLNISGNGIKDMAETIIRILKYSQIAEQHSVKSPDFNSKENTSKNEEHIVQEGLYPYGIISAPEREGLVPKIGNGSYAINIKLAEDNENPALNLDTSDVQERDFNLGSLLGNIVRGGTDMVTGTISHVAKDTGAIIESMTDGGISLVNSLFDIEGPESQPLSPTQSYGVAPYAPLPVIIETYVQPGQPIEPGMPGVPEYLQQPGMPGVPGRIRQPEIPGMPDLTGQLGIHDVPAFAGQPDELGFPGEPDGFEYVVNPY
jgi:hypothetical protein